VHPDSGAPRPTYGRHVRTGLVWLYVVAGRYVPSCNIIGVILVVHGSRHITHKLLAGACRSRGSILKYWSPNDVDRRDKPGRDV
jgi:hypothetical protein